MRFWPTFFGAFCSPETYAQARYRAQGWGFVYALKLVGISTLLGVCMLSFAFHHYVFSARNGQEPMIDRAIMQVAEQLPPFVLDQGTLKVAQEKPLIITIALDELGAPMRLFTIDTTGNTTSANMPTYVLFTATHVISRRSDGTITERPLGELTRDQPHIEAQSHEDIMELAQVTIQSLHTHVWKLYGVLVPLTWLIMTVIFFITRVFMLLALGGAAMLLSLHGRRLNYVDGVRVASVAYTPVSTFSAVAFMAGFTAIGPVALYAMGVLMVFCAISVTKDVA